jgi:Ca-activated chloride channel homolog
MFQLPTFISAERLWVLLLVPLVVALYVVALKRKSRTGMRYPNTAILGQVAVKQSQWRRHLALALSLLALAALSVAWARPEGIEMVPRERATVILVIDTSRSMQATDVEPNRLDAEKAAAIKFLDSLPAKYNVAVVSLSGNPAVRLPPTIDRSLAKQTITSLKVADSTAIGESVYSALEALSMAPKADDGTAAPGAIVLLSDGQNTAGRSPIQSAVAAKDAKVPIYTIAYGTQTGYVDLDGKRELVPPDAELLAAMAKASDGAAFNAENANDLDQVYKNISSEVGHVASKKEITATWAGYGLAFAVVAALAAVSLGARWP